MANEFIMILDFGGAQARSIAHKLRSQNYYCEIQPWDIDMDVISRKMPGGLLLVGNAVDSDIDNRLLDVDAPILAMGGCCRNFARLLGVTCEGAVLSQRAAEISFLPCPLFEGLNEGDRYFERIEAVELPDGVKPIATTADGLVPAFANVNARLYALQFYPESNDPDGARILYNFAEGLCGLSPYWSPEFYVEQEIAYLRDRIGEGEAIMAISGGVDSTVCAMLTHRAIGSKLHCVFIDTGLLRTGETEMVVHTFRDVIGLELTVIDAREAVLKALVGVTDAKSKRSIVQQQLIESMVSAARTWPGAGFLIQGTNYNDLLEAGHRSTSARGEVFPHLPTLKIIDPLRMLFKDEVRYVGESLGLGKETLNRPPFPGVGLAIRCVGEVTPEKLALLREADAIFRAEIIEAGLDRRLTHYFVILTDARTPAIRNEQITEEYAVVLRAVNAPTATQVAVAKLPYDLLERVTERITSKVVGINRVLYDLSGKPPAYIEWE